MGPQTQWASLTKGNIMASSPYDAIDGETPQPLLGKVVPPRDLYQFLDYHGIELGSLQSLHGG